MITCVNLQCKNLNQDMDENILICPLCGEETKNIKTSTDFKKRINPIISLTAIASLLVIWLPSIIAFYLGIVIVLACVVTSIIFKAKAAIITSCLSALGMIGMLFYFGVIVI